MKKIVLTFGLISGAITSVLLLATVAFIYQIGFDYGVVVGYSSLVLAFLFVFFGIRSYRENIGNGQISFGRALSVGLLITLISCICYVVTWEIVYFNFLPDFGEKYTNYIIETARSSGASAEELASQLEEMKKMKALYDNPFWNAVVTFFIEPLPIGLIVTFISAAILRKRPRETAEAAELVSTP